MSYSHIYNFKIMILSQKKSAELYAEHEAILMKFEIILYYKNVPENSKYQL